MEPKRIALPGGRLKFYRLCRSRDNSRWRSMKAAITGRAGRLRITFI